ncbi:PAS domain-containing protein [Pararhodospirillum oryzae]|uniref:Transcriptional regulator n=1 Tax=Pararhodospirillum oryzae TaxID=478448 RepID=A0A512H4M4_9PROT|nr:PAS domain-containing protein [Pararhodospirillum oryzae]GEO80402.1 transcriptional regulator [Pararhodospirillum oryzae]
MSRPTIRPTNVERFFAEDDVIVSKTDLKGIITYANKIFLDIADYTEKEVVGQPHNIIRHPEMPAGIFRLMWDTIQDSREIFAYVCNMTKGGDHYWVLAHVTPTFNEKGVPIGYHSNRRVPERRVMPGIQELYARLRAEERRHASPREGATASLAIINRMLADKGVSYDEYIHGL